jgi:pilus assembly protein Flp/PilA
MTRLISMTRGLIRDERGVTAIEYGLIATLVAVGLITALGLMGGALQTAFGSVVTALGG